MGFVYHGIRLVGEGRGAHIEVSIEPHAAMRGKCSICLKACPGYDRLPQRRWLFVPLWALPVFFLFAPRRVDCPEHGVVVEQIPWSQGKSPVTTGMMSFLAT